MMCLGKKIKTYRYHPTRYPFFLIAIIHSLIWIVLLVDAITDGDIVDAFLILLLMIIPTYILIREIRFFFQKLVIYEDGLLIKKFTNTIVIPTQDISGACLEEFRQRGYARVFYFRVRVKEGSTYSVNLHPFDGIWKRVPIISLFTLKPPNKLAEFEKHLPYY